MPSKFHYYCTKVEFIINARIGFLIYHYTYTLRLFLMVKHILVIKVLQTIVDDISYHNKIHITTLHVVYLTYQYMYGKKYIHQHVTAVHNRIITFQIYITNSLVNKYIQCSFKFQDWRNSIMLWIKAWMKKKIKLPNFLDLSTF